MHHVTGAKALINVVHLYFKTVRENTKIIYKNQSKNGKSENPV